MRILVVVGVVPEDINNIGRITAKIKAVIKKHERKNRRIAGIDSQHGNVAHSNPDLEHNHIMYSDYERFIL